MKIILIVAIILLAVDLTLNVWILIRQKRRKSASKPTQPDERSFQIEWTDEDIQSAVNEARKKCAADIAEKKEPVYVFGKSSTKTN